MAKLKAVLRCSSHASSKALENALPSDPRISKLLHDLISGYGTAEEAGGLARAVTNSDKMKGMLRAEMEGTARSADAVLGKMHSLRFAAQRWGSLTEVAGHLVTNTKPILNMLLKLDSAWSRRLLRDAFQPKNLVLLALIAEFSDAVMRFIRKLDNSGGLLLGNLDS